MVGLHVQLKRTLFALPQDAAQVARQRRAHVQQIQDRLLRLIDAPGRSERLHPEPLHVGFGIGQHLEIGIQLHGDAFGHSHHFRRQHEFGRHLQVMPACHVHQVLKSGPCFDLLQRLVGVAAHEVLDVLPQRVPLDAAPRDAQNEQLVDETVGILSHQRQHDPQQHVAMVVVKEADHPIVHQSDPPAVHHEKVAAMRICMEEAVIENHRHENAGAFPRQALAADAGLFELTNVADLDAADPFERQDAAR